MTPVTESQQRDIEDDRTIDGLCSKCGSSRITYVIYMGVRCFDCGYWHDGATVLQWRPFVMPGESGSHDFPKDVIDV